MTFAAISFLLIFVAFFLTAYFCGDQITGLAEPQNEFEYGVTEKRLREGDKVAFINRTSGGDYIQLDAVVINPEHFGCGYTDSGDYRVLIEHGHQIHLVYRSDIINVVRPYQTGDWI